MAHLFSRDIMICATAYIVADTEAEAQAKYDALRNEGLELSESDGDVPVYGGRYHAEMPDVSLSPAMTIYGVNADDIAPIGGWDMVEEDLAEDAE